MKNIALLLFLSLLIACNTPKLKNETESFLIKEFEGEEKGFNLYDFVTDIEYIPLMYGGDESLTQIISKLEVTQNFIYLLNSNNRSQKNILVFDTKGNFIKNIPKIEAEDFFSGAISDFIVDENQKLIVLDKKSNLIQLDHDFSYSGHNKLPFQAAQIHRSETNEILCYANGMAYDQQSDSLFYNTFILDKDFKIRNTFDPFEIVIGKARHHHVMFGNIQHSKNGFMYSEFLNDTIYEITGSSKKVKYLVDFDKERFDQSAFPEANIAPFSPILMDQFKWGLNTPLETDQYFMAVYYDKNIPMGLLFDKGKDKTYLFNPFKVLESENMIPWPQLSKGKNLYGIFKESSFEAMDKNIILSHGADSNVKEIYQHIQKNLNPVIVKYKLKWRP